MIILIILMVLEVIFSFLMKKYRTWQWGIKIKIIYEILLSGYIGLYIGHIYNNHWSSCFWALPIAYCMYFLSCVIVGRKMTKHNLLFCHLYPLSVQLKRKLAQESLLNIYNSTIEELIYRVGLYHCGCLIFKNKIVSYFIVVIIFTLVHDLKKLHQVQKLDILFFSISITLFFTISYNLLFAIFLHILRNQFVILQKYNDLNDDMRKAMRFKAIFKTIEKHGELERE